MSNRSIILYCEGCGVSLAGMKNLPEDVALAFDQLISDAHTLNNVKEGHDDERYHIDDVDGTIHVYLSEHHNICYCPGHEDI